MAGSQRRRVPLAHPPAARLWKTGAAETPVDKYDDRRRTAHSLAKSSLLDGEQVTNQR
jgi:hypothetical protein